MHRSQEGQLFDFEEFVDRAEEGHHDIYYATEETKATEWKAPQYIGAAVGKDQRDDSASVHVEKDVQNDVTSKVRRAESSFTSNLTRSYRRRSMRVATVIKQTEGRLTDST